MFRIDGPGATEDNKFTDGDPANGTRATIVSDEWLNAVQEELAKAIEEGGQSLDKTNSGQLSKSLNSRVIYVPSVTELEQTVGSADKQQASVYDSEAGEFFDCYWDSLSEAPADGVSVFQVTGTPVGRWIADPSQNSELFFGERPFISPITGNQKHKGLTSQIFPTDTLKSVGRMSVLVWREGVNHAYDGGSVLKAADIYGSGQQLANVRTIYNEAGVDARDFSGVVMSNGRIALMVSRRTSDTTWTTPIYLYSDDDGVTWTSAIQAGLSSGLSVDEYLHPYPTSAGGADEGGYIGFAWVNPVRDRIRWFATTDFGATWTEGDAVVGDGVQDLSEPRVVRLGDSDRWAMFIRQNQGDGLNSLAAKSTDLKNWGSLLDTGQTLGKNCASVWYDRGRIFWTAFSRPYAAATLSIDGFDDALLVQSLGAETAWDSDLSAWTGWQLLAHLFRPLGYLKIVNIDGELVGVFAQDEYDDAPEPAYSALSIVSNKSLLSDLSVQKGATNVPTTGGNFVGNYVRYRDGRQEAWGWVDVTLAINEALGGMFITSAANDINVGFPLPFLEGTTPIVDVRTVSSPLRAMPSAASSGVVNNQEFEVGFQAPVSSASTTVRFSWHAIGYWS